MAKPLFPSLDMPCGEHTARGFLCCCRCPPSPPRAHTHTHLTSHTGSLPPYARTYYFTTRATPAAHRPTCRWNREKEELDNKDDSETPAAMLRELDNPKAPQSAILSTIKALRICMTNLPMSWVIDFRDSDGLESLLTVMRKCVEDPLIDDQIQLESVRTLNSFMNNKHGLNAVLESKQAMRILARTLGSTNRKTVAGVLELMAAICLVQPVGHDLALDAMTAVSVTRSQGGSRFSPLVRLLRATENVALRVAVLQFVNSLVTAPEELDVRVHLRNEFQIAGFQSIMPELHTADSDELNFQLTIFEEEAEDDWNELLHRFHDVQFDMADESECAMCVVVAARVFHWMPCSCGYRRLAAVMWLPPFIRWRLYCSPTHLSAPGGVPRGLCAWLQVPPKPAARHGC